MFKVVIASLSVFLFSFTGVCFGQAPTNGLVGWWPFTKNAIDSSSYSNNGTVYGATLIKDRCGNDSSAYYFDGNDYIDVGLNSSLLSSSKTVNFWFKYSDTTAEMVMVGNYNSNSGEWGHNCRHHNVHGLMTDLGSGTSNRQIGFRTMEFWNDSTWHMFTSTYNKSGNVLAFYIDGCFLGYKNWDITSGGFSSTDSVQYNSSDHWMFGASSQYFSSSVNNGPRYFTGALDEVRIYNRELSSREVRALFDLEYCGCTDTTTIIKYDTTFHTTYDTIAVYDTTNIVVNDTTFSFDTTFVTIYDTSYISIYDTTYTTIFDTTFVAIHDSTFITIFDTTQILIYDTTFISQIDTIYHNIYDTIWKTIIDTTFTAVSDTLYIDVSNLDTSHSSKPVKIYPNPSRGKVIIDNGDLAFLNGYTIKVYNIIGQLIEEQRISGRFNYFDLTHLAKGHYIFVFTNTNGKVVITKRVILH